MIYEKYPELKYKYRNGKSAAEGITQIQRAKMQRRSKNTSDASLKRTERAINGRWETSNKLAYEQQVTNSRG